MHYLFRNLNLVNQTLRHLHRRIAFHFRFGSQNQTMLKHIRSHKLNIFRCHKITSLQKRISLRSLQHCHGRTWRSPQIYSFTCTRLLYNQGDVLKQCTVYKIPYETHPEDRLRQCVFGGTSNALDFLPLDRSGNRRFLPVMVYPEQAEVHILDDEAASRAYMEQLWAEAMTIYRSGDFKLSFSPEMVRYLKEHQRDFMPEDTKAGMIQAYLDRYTGSIVCSKQLFREALNHPFDEPKQWEIREVNDIMNHCVTGWHYFSNPRMFPEYGRQKGWEREAPATDTSNGAEKIPEGFVEVTEQMELPF